MPRSARTGALSVVETDDDRYLGVVVDNGTHLLIYNGFGGAPSQVHTDTVVSVTPADGHADVEAVA